MKTALITGGTSGIGLAIAKALLQDADHKVLLIGRNKEKGRAVEASLGTAYPGRVIFTPLDLSDIRAVMAFADRFRETHSELDLLANVAGVMESQRTITGDGFETTFAVGYLSAFVLSTRLSPLLEKARHGRIVNVGGVAKFVLKSKLDFEDLDFSRNFGSFKTAITTVHAKTVLTQILSQKYAPLGIDVNSFHPGAVRSDLMKSMPWWTRALFKVLATFMSKTSNTGVRVCSSPELQGTTGKYFDGNKAIDLDFERPYRDRLWQETENLLRPLGGGKEGAVVERSHTDHTDAR
jgi:NAD(P)-dependent dehydrogenase (short-subunit alcohol dehydrogenase family)